MPRGDRCTCGQEDVTRTDVVWREPGGIVVHGLSLCFFAPDAPTPAPPARPFHAGNLAGPVAHRPASLWEPRTAPLQPWETGA